MEFTVTKKGTLSGRAQGRGGGLRYQKAHKKGRISGGTHWIGVKQKMILRAASCAVTPPKLVALRSALYWTRMRAHSR